MALQVGDVFTDIASAKTAVYTFLASNKESSKTLKSDKTRLLLICKEDHCTFRIRVVTSQRKGLSITHMEPQICTPSTHYFASNSNALAFLIPHHRAAIFDNPRISPKQIQSHEKLQFANKIPYLQAFRVKEAILNEIWGDESKSFALFPDYISRLKAADSSNYAQLQLTQNGKFEAAFFTPAGLRNVAKKIRPFIAIDGTHTKSKYRMVLLVACGLDANNNVIPLA